MHIPLCKVYSGFLGRGGPFPVSSKIISTSRYFYSGLVAWFLCFLFGSGLKKAEVTTVGHVEDEGKGWKEYLPCIYSSSFNLLCIDLESLTVEKSPNSLN